MLLLTVAVAKVDHQMLRQVKLMQRVAGRGDIVGMVVRFFATAHDDMAIRVAAGLIDSHLTVFIRRQEHVAGASRTDGVDRNAGIAVSAIFKTHRAGERRSHFTVDLAFRGTSANGAPTD